MSRRAGNSHKKNALVSRLAFFSHRRSPLDTFFWSTSVGSVALLFMAGLVLLSAGASADESSQTSVTVTSACSLASTINTAHTAEITPGIFQENIGKTTFTVSCNDANGYSVYAVGYTNTEFGRNDMLGNNTGRTIATGTATTGSDSSWGMKLTAVNNSVAPTITTGYTANHAVPDDYTKVASYANSTMTEEAGSKFETTYSVYSSSFQEPDTYVGKVKYTLVHPNDPAVSPCALTYTINYNSNGGSGSMDSQTACVDRAISILPNGFAAPTPSENYQFGLWNTEADGSGYAFNPRQSVTNIADPSESITLYAIWAPKYIQDLTSNTCRLVATDDSLTVYDKRDGNDYTVRYLQNACWMTQNLRITGTVYDQYSNFSTYDSVNVCTADLTAGSSYNEPRCHDSGNTTNGVWYNYASASAKTITGSENSTIATEDICPAGWHLPSYDTAKPAGSVNSLLDLTAEGRTAFQPVTGGYYSGGSLNNTGDGYWWTTVANSAGNRYYLGYRGSSLNTYNGDRIYYRDSGNYIRCVRE